MSDKTKVGPTAWPKAIVGEPLDDGQTQEQIGAGGFGLGKNRAVNDSWDTWYASLPDDLRRKLSLHDFKRLGDCFKQAFGIE
jgi:hypothetical protein